MRYSHIIFDWDGTLMNSAGKIVSCMQLAATKSNLPVPSDKAVRHIIGISLVPAIAQLFSINLNMAEKVAAHYKEIFIQSEHTPCLLFPEAYETLQTLNESHILGVATGKARRGLERAWQSSQSGHFFAASRCADEAESKPSPDMLQQLLKHWQVDASEVLMVGDTTYDMQMAEAIDMPRIGVSYGVHDVEDIAKHQPVAIIDNIHEIVQYL